MGPIERSPRPQPAQPCPPPPPCPAPVPATCPPPPPARASSCDNVDHLRARLKSFERDNERLRDEPRRLQEAYHAQSEQIWHLRANLEECRSSARSGDGNVHVGEVEG